MVERAIKKDGEGKGGEGGDVGQMGGRGRCWGDGGRRVK